MPTQSKRRESKTAVLVVHGMGTQRPKFDAINLADRP